MLGIGCHEKKMPASNNMDQHIEIYWEASTELLRLGLYVEIFANLLIFFEDFNISQPNCWELFVDTEFKLLRLSIKLSRNNWHENKSTF